MHFLNRYQKIQENRQILDKKYNSPKNGADEGSRLNSDDCNKEQHFVTVIESEKTGSSEEKHLDNLVKKNIKGDGSNMIWEDLRPRFRCNKCYYGSKKQYLLKRHLKIHEKNSLRTDNNCNSKNKDDGICYVKSDNYDKEEHLVTRTNIKKLSQGDDNEIDNYNDIIKDKDIAEDKEKDMALKSSKDKHNDDIDGNILRGTFTCDECSYKTNMRYLLAKHANIHSTDKPYKCKICERGFARSSSLNIHLNMHYGVKNKFCKYCEKSYLTTGDLNRHVKYKHTEDRPYKCTDCNYATVEPSKLRRHIRYHTGEKRFQCQHCTYASPEASQLSRHIRKHTGEKPFKCDKCHLNFSSANGLKNHTYTHNRSDEKMHSCIICPAKCARKTDLRLHVKRMHFSDKPLNCKWCQKIFSDKYSLKVHYKACECEKCFKCQLCSFSTKRFGHLQKHMTIHSAVPEQSFISNSCLCNNLDTCPHKPNGKDDILSCKGTYKNVKWFKVVHNKEYKDQTKTRE